MSEYITMRDCLKLDLKDAITQRDNLQDQRDFAMSEMERLRRERDEAREDAKRATYDAAQETIKVSTVKSHWIEACRERDEARGLARWFYIRLKQVCLDRPLEGNVRGVLARLDEAVLDDPWIQD